MILQRAMNTLAMGLRAGLSSRHIRSHLEAGEACHLEGGNAMSHRTLSSQAPGSALKNSSQFQPLSSPSLSTRTIFPADTAANGLTPTLETRVLTQTNALNRSFNRFSARQAHAASSAQANAKTNGAEAATENFQAFIERHQAIGVGILSGLGILLCYGAQQVKDYVDSKLSDVWDEDDDEDEEDEAFAKYNLNYQLNSKAYDRITGEEQTPALTFTDPQALTKFILHEEPRHTPARDALIKSARISMPEPQAYGLMPRHINASSPSGLNYIDPTQRVDKITAAPHNLYQAVTTKSLSHPSAQREDTDSVTPPNILYNKASEHHYAPPLDRTALAKHLEQQHRAYAADCERIEKQNFSNQLNDLVVSFQHGCFLKNIPWQVAMPLAKAKISSSLLKTDPYALRNPMLAHAAMYARLKRVSYSVHVEGGRFKAHKHSESPNAKYTQIRAASGKIYALLNDLSEADSQTLLEQFGIEKSGPFVLGEGMFGKVRLAQDLDTGQIVAVKKMFSRHMANLEIREFKGIPPDDHLVSLFDYAHVRTSDGDNKSYLFMEMVGDVNGSALVKALSTQREQGKQRAEKKLLTQTILESSVAVVKLHELGIYHCDIKPENFIISHKAIHLGDYGLSTRDKSKHPGSTLAYNPLDKTYDAEKHDAFALGITFYEYMHGAHPADIGERPKTSNTDKLPGSTLEECVSKLRDEDPQKRITAREFLQLPYIQELMNRQQRAAARELVFFHAKQKQEVADQPESKHKQQQQQQQQQP